MSRPKIAGAQPIGIEWLLNAVTWKLKKSLANAYGMVWGFHNREKKHSPGFDGLRNREMRVHRFRWKNWRRAIHWYCKAAENGNVAAMHWLGRIYGAQEDFPADSRQAFYWLKMAADRGDMQSQCALGVCYVNGDGVRPDPIRGAYWYRMAAGQGDKWASYLLGLCYRHGTGVNRNAGWARFWFRKASQNGVIKASKALSRLDGRSKQE